MSFMSIDWNRVGTKAAIVVCFAGTGSLMPRLMTKIAVNPAVATISGAIFGVLVTLPGKIDVGRVFNLMVLNASAIPPFSYYYHGNKAITISVGLSALNICTLIVITTLAQIIFTKPSRLY